jgi:hypothetical protein
MKTMPEVLPVGEARETLSKVLANFRRDGRDARPVFFGSRRRAEAVIIPIDLFEQMLPILEDVLIAREIQARRARHDGTLLDFETLVKEAGFNPDEFAQ